MNDRKLKQLFRAARNESPPSPEPGFENLVLSAIRRELPPMRATSLIDQLGALFPRLAWAAALVIAMCLGADFCLTALAPTGLSDGIAEISEQWLFAAN
ncbi:MAG: hypothetical protein EXS35_10495 [Pedosphaera sp.]|nr:hypothetical protein [Pedosphaera sp.]